MKRAHIFISGKVQGVGFRWFTYKNAKRLGIKGFVRNLPDGRVEVIAEGEEEKLKEFIEILKRGPPLARVEKLEAKWEEYEGKFKDFEIRF